MANYNRNQGDQYDDSNNDWNQGSRQQYRNNDANRNSDRYNANYNDRNRNYNDRNYNDYNRHDDYRNINDNDRYNSGNRNYQDRSHTSYGSVYHGNVERREQETNQAQGGRYARMNSGSQGYGNYNRDYDNDDRNYNNQNWNTGTYPVNSDRNRGDYGNDYRHYGDSQRGYRNNDRSGYGDNYYQSGYDYDRNQRGNYDRDRNNGDRNWWDKTKNEVSSWFDGDDNDGRRTGEHRGKGPRGYQRSNDRIREDICDRLSDDDFVDASDINVEVDNGEVKLSGHVRSREEKRHAEDLVDSISGVRHVENHIRVKRDDDFNDNDDRDDDNDNDNNNERSYTGNTDNITGIGSESGTTNEIIRETGNMRRNKF